MVLGQKFLCRHVGFASGITIGLGISFGGITTPLYGYIFDHYGAQATMLAVTATACIAAVIAYFVPDIDAIRAKKALEAADNSSSHTAE
jgi:FSR family fosmidomycin resistance protein-like MFS transporter